MTETPPFIPYGRQLVDDDDVAAVLSVLREPLITQGPVVERFEAALAETVGARFAVAVNSGTAALHVACLAAGLGPGGRAATTTNTFAATANAVRYCGAEVALCDIDPATLCLSPEALGAALDADPSISVVLPVSFAGLAGRAEEIRRIAAGRTVIEDASHAIGGFYADGRPIGGGAYADMTVFSFHPVKTITSGEGGAVTTNDPELYRLLKLYRNHGIERDPGRFLDHGQGFEDGQLNGWYYEVQALGYNYRMCELQAALGLSQLGKLDRFVGRRRALATLYDQALAGSAVRPTQDGAADRARTGGHLYVVRAPFTAANPRARAINALRERGVGVQVHYVPLHRQPLYRDRYGFRPGDFQAAEDYYRQALSLPLHAGMEESDVARVRAALAAVFEEDQA